ncbi:OpgC family protein [Salipiger profundus]|uniref:OpgC family protein n=1 Tax=Salipiger profundus TaxID=1229727 RepID=UPI0008E1EBA7|nr:OpgC domain-containing protein [Salipiger profundus]SFD09379.1 hypothetical protein SAMN05444415_107137 [Salipiger profundus]
MRPSEPGLEAGGVPVAGARSARDPRIDAFRGAALVTIFIDHVPGNPYEHLTLRNWGFSDAAEAFFLMSGIAAGLAYSKGMGSGTFLNGALPVWRRSWTLYLVHLFLTFWAIAIFAGGAALFDTPGLLEKINLAKVFDMPEQTLPALPLLLHQLGYVNILPVYCVLLLSAPFLIRVGISWPKVLAGASVLLWFAAGLWRLNLPNHPNPGGWFFNPFSWQIIFVMGLLTGIGIRKGERFVPVSRGLFWAAVGFLVLVLAWRYVPGVGAFLNHQMARLGAAGVPFHIVSHDKTFVAVPRLLHALSLAYVLSCLPVVRRAAAHDLASPFRLLGRHGLLVFAAGTLASLAFQVVLSSAVNPAPLSWMVLPLGAFVMLGVALLAEKRRKGGGGSSGGAKERPREPRMAELGPAPAVASVPRS